MSALAKLDARPPPAPGRRWFSGATDPHILFPALALLGLTLIWTATYDLIRVERAAAEHAAVVSTAELAETYEAQAVRALREIDQTLKLVKYVYEARGEGAGQLQRLKARLLLPADLLFVVSIADDSGAIVASTRAPELDNIAGEDYFEVQKRGASLAIGAPHRSLRTGEWRLSFSRRLNAADGRFAGIVVLSVDAAYFVSGYEAAKLGEHGAMGLLGSDGVVRALRRGDVVSAGDTIDYPTMVPAPADTESAAAASIGAWDGVRRYMSARRLYEFPLAVIVGLAEDEQLAASGENARAYVMRAIAGSLILLALVAVLGRLSWQLARARATAAEAQLEYSGRVEYLAYHDALTTLPNRSLFSTLLAQSINQGRRHDRHLAVLFLDLDGFKLVNDTLGHAAGDQLLEEVARRLAECLRDSDTVARLGGDEFVVLLPELGENEYAAIVAEKILAAVVRPYLLLGQEFRITTSIGVSVYPQDGRDVETLIKNADGAMYRAKQRGKNNYQFHSEAGNAGSRGDVFVAEVV